MERFPLWIYKPLDYPEDVIIPDLLKRASQKWPNKVATIFSGSTITFGEYEEAASRFATALADMGIQKGDRVAVDLPNCPQFIIAYYGILKLGAIYTPCNPMLSEVELEYQLKDSGAEAIVALDLIAPRVEKVREKTMLKRVIVTGLADCSPLLLSAFKGSERQLLRGAHDFLDLLKQYPPNTPQVKINAKEDLAHLQYTGGTTGVPKGAMITHYNMIVAQGQMANMHTGGRLVVENGGLSLKVEGVRPTRRELRDYPYWEGTGTVVTVTPFFGTFGMASLNHYVLMGMTQVLMMRFEPGAFLEAVDEWGPMGLTGAPALFVALLNHPDFGKRDLSSVRIITSGSAPISPEILDRLHQAMPDAVVSELYGLTEACVGVTGNPRHRSGVRKIGSVGVPWSNEELKLVDIETGEKEVEIGEEGEIFVRGPNVMKGYWNRLEETMNTIRDGWLYTGDIGKWDEDGYLYIVDRKKDMLIYKGWNVYPTELENVLYEHPAVAECAVVGKSDPEVGEMPKAFVVLKEGATATAEELMDFANSRLASYKKIREVEFMKQLPKSGVMKVLRRALKE